MVPSLIWLSIRSARLCAVGEQKFFVKLLYTKVCGGTGATPLWHPTKTLYKSIETDCCFDAVVREHRFPKGNLIFSQMICRTSVRGRNTMRHASRLQVVSAYPQKNLPSACHVLKLPLHTKPKREGQCFVFCSKQVLCSLSPRMSLRSILRKFDFKNWGQAQPGQKSSTG